MNDGIHYSLDELLKTNSRYHILLGEKSNGKSYAVKYYTLTDSWHNGHELIYIRRWSDEVKQVGVERYFCDLPIAEITGGEATFIRCYRSQLFFSRIDESGDVINVKKCGDAIALSTAAHHASMAFPQAYNLIYEEFCTTRRYLTDEVNEFMKLVSTILRHRSGKVFLIGNTVNRLNPFFREWGLNGVLKMRPGEINIYEHESDGAVVRIGVEMCKSVEKKNLMFFGRSAKMINHGEWEASEHPHLPRPFEDYETIYQVLLMGLEMSFMMRVLRLNGHTDRFVNYVVFVHPHEPDFNGRVIHEKPTTEYLSIEDSRLHTVGFAEITKGDRLLHSLMKAGNMAFSDNLTGDEFNIIMKKAGGL